MTNLTSSRTEPLRILQVNSGKEFGGGESHLLTLANGLAHRGNVVSFAVRPNGPLPKRLPDHLRAGLHVVPLRNSLDVFSARRLAQIIKAEKIDIVHCHYARDYLIGAMAVKLAGLSKLVLTRHLLLPTKNNLGYRKALSVVSRMICVSESVRQVMINANMFDPDRIVTIHNGIDLDRFKSKKSEDSRQMAEIRKGLGLTFQNQAPLIGVVGQLSPHKGQEDFIRAAVIISKSVRAANFVVIGRDQSKGEEYKMNLMQLISETRLSDRIKILESTDEMPAMMAALDILVLPSLAEPFGLVLIEAMASGTNVIATNLAGPSEIIQNQKTGLLVSPGKPDQIAQAVISLLEDLPLKKRLAENAAQAVRERFSAEKMVAETEKVYHQALSKD